MVPTDVPHNAAFRKFIDTLGKEQARDLVREINSFMKDFRRDDPNPSMDSMKLQTFLTHMEARLASHPLFASCTPQELEEAIEGMEKYLTTKMFDRLFGVSPEEQERDAELATRFQALQFVKLEHLEVAPGVISDASLVHAISSLREINSHKAPREKLQCVLRCCSFINNLLLSNSGSDFGADDFTPVLIYVVIRAQPEKLAANLTYIENFRMQARLQGEAQYYFTQLYGAAAFIETMDASSLKVDPDEFLAHMLAHGAMGEELLHSRSPMHRGRGGAAASPFHQGGEQPGERGQKAGASGQQDPPAPSSLGAAPAARRALAEPTAEMDPPDPPPPAVPPKSAAELEEEGLPLLLQAEAEGQLRARHRYLYSTMDGLTVRDVQQLLGDYKELVLRFEALSLAADQQLQVHFARASSAPPPAPPSIEVPVPAPAPAAREAAPASAARQLRLGPLAAAPAVPTSAAAAAGSTPGLPSSNPGLPYSSQEPSPPPSSDTTPLLSPMPMTPPLCTPFPTHPTPAFPLLTDPHPTPSATTPTTSTPTPTTSTATPAPTTFTPTSTSTLTTTSTPTSLVAQLAAAASSLPAPPAPTSTSSSAPAPASASSSLPPSAAAATAPPPPPSALAAAAAAAAADEVPLLPLDDLLASASDSGTDPLLPTPGPTPPQGNTRPNSGTATPDAIDLPYPSAGSGSSDGAGVPDTPPPRPRAPAMGTSWGLRLSRSALGSPIPGGQ